MTSAARSSTRVGTAPSGSTRSTPVRFSGRCATRSSRGGPRGAALPRLSRGGMPGRMEGMKDLLERLRTAKQKRAERHDLSNVFDELKEKLEEVKHLERSGLERRRDAEAPNEQLRQGMQKIAHERLAQLDALPDDFGRAVRALKDYEFVEPKAAEKYQELLKDLQEQVLGS